MFASMINSALNLSKSAYNSTVEFTTKTVAPAVCDAYEATAKWTKETAVPVTKKAAVQAADWTVHTGAPAVAHAAEFTLKAVDAGCMSVNKGGVEFLNKYPGIAMSLSPSSMIKMAAATHVERIMNGDRSKGARPQVTINMTQEK